MVPNTLMIHLHFLQIVVLCKGFVIPVAMLYEQLFFIFDPGTQSKSQSAIKNNSPPAKLVGQALESRCENNCLNWVCSGPKHTFQSG